MAAWGDGRDALSGSGTGEVELPWLEHWTAARLRDRFGERSLRRAREYADTGRVVRLWSSSPVVLGALVQGTVREPYEVLVRHQVIRRPGVPRLAWLHCHCTCPVRTDCKHAIAAVIHASSLHDAGFGVPSSPSSRVHFGPWPGADSADAVREDGVPGSAGVAEGPAAASASHSATGAAVSGASSWLAEPGLFDGLPGVSRNSPSTRSVPARTPRVPAPPEWEMVLSPVVAAARRAQEGASQRVAAAVRFTLAQPGTRRFGAGAMSGLPDIKVRPVKKGASGRWIKTGIGWENLEAARGELVPNHYSALLALRGLRTPNRYAYQQLPEEISLSALGPRVWDVLAEAAAAGVEFEGDFGRRGRRQPRVLTTPARVELVAVPDTTPRAGIALGLRVTHEDLGLDVDLAEVRPDQSRADRRLGLGSAASLPAAVREQREAAGPLVWLVGSEPHGVVVWRADEVAFAPLERPLGSSVGVLAEGPLPVRVPAADVPRFTAEFLPALRRAVQVTASEGVGLPEAVPPRLAVTARFGPEHRVALTTETVYVADHVVEAADYLFRDPAAEQQLIDTFPAELAPPGLLVRVAGRKALAPAQAYTGTDLITVATKLLPELVRRPDVRVTIEGDPPEYQEHESEPVIEVRLDDHLGVTDGEAAGNDRQERTDWFNLGVTVRVGRQVVSFVELFTALAKQQAELLLPGGEWFSLERPEFEELRGLIEESRYLLDPEKKSLRVTPVHLGLWEHLVALGVVEAESAAWREKVAALTGADQEPPEPPAGLLATLRPYQLEGYAWMVRLWRAGLGGILADDMGLGKTVQVLALAAAVQQAGELSEAPMLVVAPTSVVGTWVAEAAKFTPGLRVATLTATTRKSKRGIAERIVDSEGRRAHLVVTTYTIARIDEKAFAEQRWAAMFLDEAQFVKNYRSKTYAALRSMGVPVRFAITGTPLENGLMDLWSLLSLTSPGLLPDPQTFSETYRRPIEEGTDPSKRERLVKRIAPMMLRRTKEQVAAELPPKQEQTVRIDLAPAHRRAYDVRLARERRRVLKLADNMQRNRVAIFSSLTMLRQLALAPGLVDEELAHIESTKVEVLIDLLREVVEGGHRALVFSQFTRYLGLVRERLEAEGIGTAYLDGGTRDRQGVIESFRAGEAPVFCISLKAGGFGLTLTEADYVFLLDPWWNPAAEQQAVDRTHRIGQTRQVMVYRLVAADTIEDKVIALQERKRDLAGQILGDGSGLGGALTADDLRELFD